MILGIGTDMVNRVRIEKTIARYGQRFITRIFHENEQKKAMDRRYGQAATYAKHWAAKEACSKALGSGLKMGIGWRDIWVQNLATGQPVIYLAGWAKARLDAITPGGYRAAIHLSLSDDDPWAQAYVIVEARKRE